MKNTLKKTILLTAIGVYPVFAACANGGSFKVKNIELKGLNRVSANTIYGDIPIKKGSEVNSKITNESIQDLYGTGYFKDIELTKSNNNLIFNFTERPAIDSVSFVGNNKIKKEDIKKVLTKANLSAGDIYNPQTLFLIKQSLLAQYSIMGYYSAEVISRTRILPQNKIAIDIIIKEGKKAKVRRVNIIGNKDFSEKTLLDELTLRQPSLLNLWGIFTDSSEYSPIRLRSSKAALTDFYLNRGYLDFRIVSEQSSLTSNKENAFLTFDISEGKKYSISSIDLKDNSGKSKKIVNDNLDIHKGDVFSKEKLLKAVNAIKEELGNKGFAFANVNPVPEIDHVNHTVKISIYISPGQKVYVRNINFLGNNVTNEYVYRRDMQYYESSVYNKKMVAESKNKLLRTMPFVKDVKVRPVPVPGSNDMVDLDYKISERSANSVKANIGWSDLYKFMVGARLNLPNIFGTGNTFSFSGQYSKPVQQLNLTYTDPFFTNSGISQTVNAYVGRSDLSSTSLASYQSNTLGVSLDYGVPISLLSSLHFGGGVDRTQINESSGETSKIVQHLFNTHNGENNFNSFYLNFGWGYNSTNRVYFPSSGYKLNLSGKVAVPGSDLEYYKANASASYYYPVIGNATLKANFSAGFGMGYGKTKYLPFFDDYYGGGWGSVRGYAQGSMGPKDQYSSDGGTTYKQGNSIGGNLAVHANFDLLFPIPGVKDSSSMRLGAFFDAGNIYNTRAYPSGILSSSTAAYKTPNFSNLKYSAGIEFKWLSPIGAMAFSLAKPLNVKSGDDTQIFQFTLGSTF